MKYDVIIIGAGGAAWSLIVGMLTQGMLERSSVAPEEHLEALKFLVQAATPPAD